jgi:UPF0271 protein
MAAKNAMLAEAIAEAVYQVNPQLIFLGLAGSELIKAGNKLGLRTASEVFSDRTYQEDGSLTPRNEPKAIITNENQAIKQVIRMVKEGKVRTIQGTDLSIKAETICIHGDGIHAIEFAKQINAAFKAENIVIAKVLAH